MPVSECTVSIEQDILPNNTHSGSHEWLATVYIVGDEVQDVEDRLDIRLEHGGYISSAPYIHRWPG